MNSVTLLRDGYPLKIFRNKIDMFKWMEANILDRQEIMMYDYRKSNWFEKLLQRVLTKSNILNKWKKKLKK